MTTKRRRRGPMHGSAYARKRLWRWRNSPLRRRDDIVEAWIVLAVWTAVIGGGTVAGLTTARAANEVFTEQRAQRHAVRAVLLTDVPRTMTATVRSADRTTASVRWTSPDGVSRTGRTSVSTGHEAGAEVTVWQDGQGHLVSEPTDPATAAIEAGLLGAAAALALTGLACGAGAAARRPLDRRRIDAWGREWDLDGPRWNHRTN
ncbi:Rv1733c family protein [Streptomyces sp. SLBN-115]|uniref:Rv1733c family protein n=1 Tax=Streptomyces sp. SLBN-115 TaxID=2768453 RepID=UPI001F4502BC|nr:hypothetical protein [Streptomyces sp. SLBN-115]